MGISWINFQRVRDFQVLKQPGQRVLDVGCSNVYSADQNAVADFVRHYNPNASGIEEFAAEIERGSAFDHQGGGLNEAFAGQVFEAAGFGYDAIDVAKAYNTTILDLNSQAMPAPFQAAFDLVLNFGTTEHVLNQYNAFKAIHEATKAGGYMWHQLPASGHVNHGYFCYTGRFFIQLAQSNGYEIFDMWVDGPVGSEDLSSSFRHFQPLLGGLDHVVTKMDPAFFIANPIPTAAITAIFRKREAAPFRLPLETTTSVGEVPDSLLTRYGRTGKGDLGYTGQASDVTGVLEVADLVATPGSSPTSDKGLAVLSACIVQTLSETDPTFQARFMSHLAAAMGTLPPKG